MADTKLSELVEIARTLGRHPARLVLWSEGSCAAKNSAGRLFVSRRGAQMAKLAEAELVELNADKLLEFISLDAVTEEVFAEALVKPAQGQPSIDAILYAFLLSLEGVNFAIHTQPAEINQITCSPRARQFADRRSLPDEILACGAASVLVPYADPGLNLAKELKRKLQLWRDRFKIVPRLILLQNHGMIVLGATPDEVMRTTEMAIKSAQSFIGAAMMGGPIFLSPANVTQIETLKEL